MQKPSFIHHTNETFEKHDKEMYTYSQIRVQLPTVSKPMGHYHLY